MKTAAIIAEFNPLHTGHQWLMDQCRAAGATHLVVILGGNFLQRGEPALFEKRRRAEAAIRCGADLVIELPLPYAMATAERFAFGGVSIAESLNCVDLLAFGSETGNLALLSRAAKLLNTGDVPEKEEFSPFRQALEQALATGATYAKARSLAAQKLLGEEFSPIFSNPNDLLAIEYLRQLDRCKSSITPITFLRQGAGHHASAPSKGYASGSFLRQQFRLGENWQSFLPPEAIPCFAGQPTAQLQRAEAAVLYRMRTLTPQQAARLPDLSEGIENRLLQAANQANSLEELYFLIKTKRYTLARIRRLVLSAFLDIPEIGKAPPPYLRILAIGERGGELLHLMGRYSSLPVSHSLARLEQTGDFAARLARLEARSCDIYSLCQLPAHRLPCGWDYRAPVVKRGNKSESRDF